MLNRKPVVGDWYQDTEAGVIFEVVAFDEEEGTVEVQHIDGQVEEYELSAWRQMPLVGVAPPEDWRSGFELSREDGIDTDAAMRPEDWSGPLDDLEADDGIPDEDWSDP